MSNNPPVCQPRSALPGAFCQRLVQAWGDHCEEHGGPQPTRSEAAVVKTMYFLYDFSEGYLPDDCFESLEDLASFYGITDVETWHRGGHGSLDKVIDGKTYVINEMMLRTDVKGQCRWVFGHCP